MCLGQCFSEGVHGLCAVLSVFRSFWERKEPFAALRTRVLGPFCCYCAVFGASYALSATLLAIVEVGLHRAHLPSVEKVALRHRQLRCGLAGQQFPIGAHFIGFGMHFDFRRRGVQFQVRFANAAGVL